MEHLLPNKSNYKIVSNNLYDFLDPYSENVDCEKIYKLINSHFDYQLINIYNFIRIRILILKQLISTDVYEIKKYNKITPTIFNGEIKLFIDNNIVFGIFVINSIIIYNSPR